MENRQCLRHKDPGIYEKISDTKKYNKFKTDLKNTTNLLVKSQYQLITLADYQTTFTSQAESTGTYM